MRIHIILHLCEVLIVLEICGGSSSPLGPFANYAHSVTLQANTAQLWWTVNHVEQEIIFELHMKTTGWVALGISPAGGMKGADIAIGWVDSTGKAHIQDRFAYDKTKPVIDNSTQDWFLLEGKEQDEWTAIRFKRYFDSCDPMDVPIKSGTNILIFAYGLVDIDLCQSKTDIAYHKERRGSRRLPLRSYADPPTENLAARYDYFDLRFDNVVVPATDTTYYCKVFKIPPRITTKRHAIAHEVLIDQTNKNLLHHLDLFECDPDDVFDDAKLPDGICDAILSKARMCSSKLATAWAVGGDPKTTYIDEVGYPVSDGNGAKYFMIKAHFDDPKLTANMRDSSGVRFYLSDQLRRYDLGYLFLGTQSTPAALAIPPQVERFNVDSYCPPEATRNFPASGITVLSAIPHTHLQGISVWSKLIRNNTAVEYLFNADAYDFNHQFENRLSKPIKIYPGDAIATRCVYNTKNKDIMTLGGQRTVDEMCAHFFSYYPYVDSLSACVAAIDGAAWRTISNTSLLIPIDNTQLQQYLLNLSWTSESTAQWQEFYDKAQRHVIFVASGKSQSQILPVNPSYEDLAVETCEKREAPYTNDQSCNDSVARQST